MFVNLEYDNFSLGKTHMIIAHHTFHDSPCNCLSNLEYDTFSLGETHMIIANHTVYGSHCNFLPFISYHPRDLVKRLNHF